MKLINDAGAEVFFSINGDDYQQLDNGDIGIVSRPPETQAMNRPWVLMLYPDGRGGFEKGEEINLAEKDQTGYYYRSVVSSANPVTFNIQPAEYISLW